MKESSNVVIFITTDTEEEAHGLTDLLLRQRKAACVNILSNVYSRYWWQGKIESDNESLLIVKTKASLLDQLISLVKENLSYEVPEIIALPILGGNQDYLNWIDSVLD